MKRFSILLAELEKSELNIQNQAIKEMGIEKVELSSHPVSREGSYKLLYIPDIGTLRGREFEFIDSLEDLLKKISSLEKKKELLYKEF